MNQVVVESAKASVRTEHDRAIAVWLFIIAGMVFAMVILGGVTRLTGSGLSMVEWNPVLGVMPPMTDTQWQDAFTKYQQSPEFKIKNFWMKVDDFKKIFVFEYAHRMLGRLIGLAFLIPLIVFWRKGWLRREMRPRLITLFILGGAQGLLGWFMVKSGLVDRPQVSQYRLTAHLAMALLIYGYLIWVALDLARAHASAGCKPAQRLTSWLLFVLGFVVLTILSGGFVAGLKAGHAYNTFPLMDGHFIPQAYTLLSPYWLNWFENIAAVQFNHRLLALTAFALVLITWWRLRHSSASMLLRHFLLLAIVLQVTLGIATLLNHVPVSLASAHQAGALVVFTLLLICVHGEIKSNDHH